MKIREIGEFGLIDKLVGRLGPGDESVVVGIGDDAAVTAYASGTHVVTTTDMLVEGVHFRTDTIDDRSLGYKSLAVSISDIAAMGARPRHAVISLAIPVEMDVERLEDLYAGVADICAEFATVVVGGDITKTSGPLVISVTLLGEIEAGRALLRSGAKPGDLLFVTGTVGGSAAGLDYLEHGRTTAFATRGEAEVGQLLQFHQRPRPQVVAGRLLLESGACTSLNDVSDGLASECNEIAKLSGVRLELDAEQLPLHDGVRQYAALRELDPVQWALFGGEDYQLVGTIQPTEAQRTEALFAKNSLSLTVIGRVTAEQSVGVTLHYAGQAHELKPKGYNHFG
ncbi:thiamine-phosphate kinase [Tumebacillus permanentifrigoris]|uniref:Thiamine-monophosphate kinase n=1 Tax=Tumebacillus permanentifrigoris TaxID=378543 RepID=A0A316D828_9BACL|nr:thiamine-phosphate kinase [Tumebacillus permanentifrigoris]PWK05995.1 thiamine-monophosphate kinase [Tumebacillus permanentifrigoris]